MSDATCQTCPHWRAYKALDEEPAPGLTDTTPTNMGDCRLHPPSMVATSSTTFDARFPYTFGHEWCGEHPARIAQGR